jgi:uncharacterized iron-regulated membrane protein
MGGALAEETYLETPEDIVTTSGRRDRWPLRRLVFWCHLTVACTFALPIAIMSVTGTLMAFQRQITTWASTRNWTPPASPASQLPLDSVVARARVSMRGAKLSSLTITSGAPFPILATFEQQRTVAIDPYTGTVLTDGTGVRAFFSSVERWHRTMGMRDAGRTAGKMIAGTANLLFLFLILSGLFLWVPRPWAARTIRPILLPNGRVRGRARNWNWHHVTGIWMAPALFAIVLSGVFISFDWSRTLVERATGSPHRPRGAQGALGQRPEGRNRERTGGASIDASLGLDSIFGRAAREVPHWRSIQLRLPQGGGSTVNVTAYAGVVGRPDLRTQLTFSGASGQLMKVERYSASDPARKIFSWGRFIHTGEAGGLIGQLVAALVSAGAALMVWTGIGLALGRFGRWGMRV